MTKKSGSSASGSDDEDFVSAVDRMRREAAPVIAKALDLDRAEAAEAALNAVTEIALAVRELVRAMPLPPESRRHVENAEREAVRAAKLTIASLDKQARGRAAGSRLQKVSVEFKGAPPAEPKRAPRKRKAARKRKR